MDPKKKAAIRRLLIWTLLGYGALIGGIAWMLYATTHWPGSRGLLGIALVVLSALLFLILAVAQPAQ